MELNFVIDGCPCMDTTQHIEQIIQRKNWNSYAEDYRRVHRDCITLYQTAEKALHSKGISRTNRKTLTDFLKVMYETFEEIGQYGNRPPLEDFQDGIDYTSPNWCGVYLVGATHFNPLTHEEFYWIKNGKAKDISKRMAQYDTCNPMTYHIDFKKCETEKQAYAVEGIYKAKLAYIALNSCAKNDEWFRVSRETYLTICKGGYNYLDNLPL